MLSRLRESKRSWVSMERRRRRGLCEDVKTFSWALCSRRAFLSLYPPCSPYIDGPIQGIPVQCVSDMGVFLLEEG